MAARHAPVVNSRISSRQGFESIEILRRVAYSDDSQDLLNMRALLMMPTML